MGFNSGFKGLIYTVHLVGYFHSCITMHGFMNVKHDKHIGENEFYIQHVLLHLLWGQWMQD